VDCHHAAAAPFDANVNCMLKTAVFGDKHAERAQAPGIRKGINCAARSTAGVHVM